MQTYIQYILVGLPALCHGLPLDHAEADINSSDEEHIYKTSDEEELADSKNKANSVAPPMEDWQSRPALPVNPRRREKLIHELEEERHLRLESEKRLREVTRESERNRTQMRALQQQFSRSMR
uniref:Uncharacterized protein n=1 Tax=Sphaerodactylus townsendi TaxID=933632 RepID=A0ACB8G1G5_9SAUR